MQKEISENHKLKILLQKEEIVWIKNTELTENLYKMIT